MDQHWKEEHAQFCPPQYRPTKSGFDWIKGSVELFMLQPGAWMTTMIVGALLAVGLSLIPFVNTAVGVFTTYIWTGGLMLGCQAALEGEKFKFEHLFAAFKRPYILPLAGMSALVSILTSLIFMLAMDEATLALIQAQQQLTPEQTISLLKSILIVMVITLPVFMAVWFAPVLIVNHNFTIFSAMKYSFQACIKNAMPFLIYGVVLATLWVISAITFGLLLLAVAPITYISMFVGYRDIFYQPPTETVESSEQEPS